MISVNPSKMFRRLIMGKQKDIVTDFEDIVFQSQMLLFYGIRWRNPNLRKKTVSEALRHIFCMTRWKNLILVFETV